MSTEPERDIEKTLRAYAKQRREEGGAAPELHPATRRLLQDEVTRRRNRVRAQSFSWRDLLWGTWPRLAFTTSAIAAVLLAVVIIVIPSSKNGPVGAMALNDVEKDKADRDASKLTIAPIQTKQQAGDTMLETSAVPRLDQPGALLAQEAPGASKPTSLAAALPANAPVTPAPTTASSTTPVLPTTVAEIPAQPANLAMQTTQPIAAPAIASARFADSDSLKREVTVVTQQFARAQVPRPTISMDSTSRSALLTTFRLEREGDQLRVIDSDGSVYNGAITSPELAKRDSTMAAGQSSVAKEVSAASGAIATMAPAGATSTNATYSFHVSGTNVSMNQVIDFSGSLVLNDGLSGPAFGGGGGAGGRRAGGGARGGRGGAAVSATNAAADSASNKPVSAADSSQTVRMRLQGQAVFGTNRVDVNAVELK